MQGQLKFEQNHYLQGYPENLAWLRQDIHICMYERFQGLGAHSGNMVK